MSDSHGRMSSVSRSFQPTERRQNVGAFRRSAFACALFLGLAFVSPAFADRIILRNLTVLSEVTVENFDLDGVKLSDGRTFGWDEIERGQIAADRQAEFDKILGEVGIPLLRIRQNLESGAHARLAEVVEPVLAQYQDRRGPTAYLVNQAAMWGRLAQGRREEAVASYARCLALLAEDPTVADRLPGKRRMAIGPLTGLVGDISPVFFDSAVARTAYEEVVALIRERNLRQPGVYAYAAALAVAAGEIDVAEKVQGSLQGAGAEIASLKELLALEIALAKKTPDVEAARTDFAKWERQPEGVRPAWLFVTGAAMASAEDATRRDEGIAALLHVPALYASSEPTVSAAALDAAAQAAERAGDAKAASRLRAELTSRFPDSSFARELASEKS
jgi:hypothetical protein